MCRFKLFTIVAAALMMAACSTEDITQQPKTGEMQFTATIAAPNKGGTRTAYTVDGTDIKVAWKVGDEIALVHKYVKDVATVKSVDATTGQATISGIITGTPADGGEDVKLIYPAAYISGVDNDRNPTMNKEYYNQLFAQDGTLDYIQNNIDFREGEGQLSVTETGVTLKSTVIMESSIAIWKLTLQNDAATPAALAATKVTIKGKFTSEGQDEDLASTTELSPGASTVYLAVPVKSDTYASLTIEATVGDDTYAYTKENVTLAPGKYYQSTVTMEKIVDLSTVTTATTIEDGYTVTGTLGKNVKITIADNATVTLNNVSINADDVWKDGSSAGITCLGDATINLEGTNNKVKGFGASYPGIYVPVNKTLIIQGSGSLDASSGMDSYAHMFGAGIGGGSGSCGNITIKGGNITATGGGAGIGSGYNQGTCGDITISGGTVTATGGYGAAGIGSGEQGTCTTITISGGTVKATGGTDAAGIGSGTGTEGCGAITISGGTVTATGGENAAGIGSGYEGTCTTITISGGTVTATGGNGNGGAGIGTGDGGSCGNITITTGVTKVTATKGSGSPNSIGIGPGRSGSCGTVTIDGTVYWDGEAKAYKNGGDTYLTQSTIVYPSPFANVTASDLGKVIGSDGKIYADATAAEAASTTAVAVICYVGDAGTADASSATYKGLALALTDANSGNSAAWCSQTSNTCLGTQYDNETAAKGDMAGIANTDALVGHATHTHAAASAARGYNSGTHPTGTSAWFLPSAGQWEKMIAAAGNYSALITRASLKSDDNYWSSSELSSYFAWRYDGIYGSGWGQESKDISRYVRACLAF